MLTETASPIDGSPNNFAATWSAEAFESSRLEGLINDLIPDRQTRNGRNFGVHVIDGNDEHSDVSRHIEHTVFDRHYGNNLEIMKQEYGRFDAVSTFLLVLDYEKKVPAATIRIIGPSPNGLKSMNDLTNPEISPWQRPTDSLESRWQEIGNQPEHTVDILTMAVMPEYKSNHAMTGASASLYSTCVRWSLANGYNRWVSIMDDSSDKSIYKMIQSWGEPFIAFEGAEPAFYLGSERSIPVYTELNAGLERIRQFDQKMVELHGQPMDVHGLYTRGAGLEGQFVLPDFSDNVQ